MGSVVAILIGLALESCNSEERVSVAKRAADVTALDRESTARQPGRQKPPSKLPPKARPSEQRRPPNKRLVTKRRPAAKPTARPSAPRRPRCVPRLVRTNEARTEASTPRKLAKPQLAQKPAAKDVLDVTKARRSVTKAGSANGKSWVPEPVRPPLRLDTRRHVGGSPSYGNPR